MWDDHFIHNHTRLSCLTLPVLMFVDQGDVGYPGVSGTPGPQGPPVSDRLQSVFSFSKHCDLWL